MKTYTIKPLEWQRQDNGSYRAYPMPGGFPCYTVSADDETFEETKASCEADWLLRLELVLTPVEDEVTRAMRIAGQHTQVQE